MAKQPNLKRGARKAALTRKKSGVGQQLAQVYDKTLAGLTARLKIKPDRIEDAQDAMQEAVVSILTAHARRGPKSSIRNGEAYLIQAAINAYLKERGRRRPLLFSDLPKGATAAILEELPGREEDPADFAARREMEALLGLSIESLPARQRSVLGAVRRGRTHIEISRTLKLGSVATSRSLLRHGLSRLMRRFQEVA